MSIYRRFVDLGKKINKKNYLVAVFRLEEREGEDFLETAGGVAAESSVGTWTGVKTEKEKSWQKLHGRVFWADRKEKIIKIAYPVFLFEAGNISQLLSSCAGNIFGLKEIKCLRLLDLEFPESYVAGFLGPKYGIEGFRKRAGVKKRPVIGSIVKPKIGLTVGEQVEVVKEVYLGGGDFVKDDENLTSLEFNNFYERVKRILDMMRRNGFLKKKIYAFNVTASFKEMVKRAKYVEKMGGNCIMVDVVTCGFSAVQALREEDINVLIHGHRAMHAALTRGKDFGVSMLFLAKLARLAGVDSLHTGTVVGKMEGGKDEVLKINNFLRKDFFGLKPVLPVASGGLHPGLVGKLIDVLGTEILINFGGGIHGHLQGSRKGAKAVKQAVEARIKGIDLETHAKENIELKRALEKWGENG